MDVVPKSTRARWKSLDSVTAFGWCGSAALGGRWTDQHGYMYTFAITAMMQALAICMLVPLLALVPRFEAKPSQDTNLATTRQGALAGTGTNARPNAAAGESTLHEPLLQGVAARVDSSTADEV